VASIAVPVRIREPVMVEDAMDGLNGIVMDISLVGIGPKL